MATDNEGNASPLLLEHIDPIGDLDFPISPGKPFATIKTDNPPPDLAASEDVLAKANLGCDISQGAVISTILGILKDDGSGLYVKPLWSVSEDRMTMTLDVYPKDCFGNVIDDERIRDAIPLTCKRLDNDAIDGALENAKKKDGPVKDVPVGSGKEAEQGRDGELKLAFKEGRSVGEVQADGSMDYRERGATACVGEGEVIAQALPFSKGHPGFDVLGEELPAEDGQPVTVKIGTGVESAEDAHGVIVFKATSPGMVVFSDDTLSVSDVVEINSDIDLASGNVRVDKGSVMIRGTVTTGSSVTAEEHVVVDGVVENATIKAGGNVTVSAGVLMEEGGLIEATGNVEAKFMRNATIRAGGDVIVEQDFVNCDIQAGGRIIAESDKGVVNGGEYVCAGMDVAEVGTDVGAVTTVTLALPKGEGPDVDRQICIVRDKITELEKYIGGHDVKDALLLAPKEDRAILLELFKIKTALHGKLKKLKERKETELKEQGESLAQVKLKARKVAHAGVTINIADRSIKLNKPEQGSKFHWDAEQCGIAITGM